MTSTEQWASTYVMADAMLRVLCSDTENDSNKPLVRQVGEEAANAYKNLRLECNDNPQEIVAQINAAKKRVRKLWKETKP